MIFLTFALKAVRAGDSVQVACNAMLMEAGPGILAGTISSIPETGTYALASGNPQPRQTTSVFRRKRTKVGEGEFGIGGNVLGPTLNYASACLQYSFSRALQAEAGLDLSSVYAGFNLFPRVILRTEGLAPYMGLMIGYSDPDNRKTANGVYAYMPVGIRFLTTGQWYICAELAATTADNVRSSPLFLGLKLGLLFKRE